MKAIIGNALLHNLNGCSDFDLMIRGVLKTTIKPGSNEFNLLETKTYGFAPSSDP